MAQGDGQILTLAAARDHLRIGEETSDAQLAEPIAAAEAAIADELGRSLIGTGGWPSANEVPPNVRHAVKLALTSLWDDRTAALPVDAIRSLIGRHVINSFA